MKEQIGVGIVIAVYLFFCLFVLDNLTFYTFFGNKPFVLELFKTSFDLPFGAILLSSCLNILLFYLIVKKLFSRTLAFITIGLYAISSWSIYLGVFNSLYVLATFFLLLLGLGVLHSQKGNLGLWFQAIGIFGLLAVSPLFLFVLLAFLILNNKFNLLSKKQVKYLLLLTIIFQGFIFLLAVQDKTHFKQVILRQVTIFNDVGLINTVNSFQGETQKANIGILGRIVENKYTYLTLKVILNVTGHLAPQTFFTPKYKLLGFSNLTPLLLGFLVPLVWGIMYLKKRKKLILVSGLFFMLTLPSVLASNSPDLNRLFIASPLIFLIIGLGIERLFYIQKKLFWLILILVAIQELIVISDIYMREGPRLLQLVFRIYG